MATSLKLSSLPIPSKTLGRRPIQRHLAPIRHVATAKAFRRSDFDGFAKRITSGEAWRDAWRTANDGFEQLLYETKKAAERIDRRYSVSRRFSAVTQAASDRARELDREFELTQRWRTFSLDFSRNWPRYRKQFNDFLDTPLGKSFATLFFLWFALSGWLFRILLLATWVLPLAGPLLIGAFANNLVIKIVAGLNFLGFVMLVGKYSLTRLICMARAFAELLIGACPACRRQFVGYKNQTVRCAGCGNIVWQPQGDFFPRGSKSSRPSSRSDPDVIDVEFEEK